MSIKRGMKLNGVLYSYYKEQEIICMSCLKWYSRYSAKWKNRVVDNIWGEVGQQVLTYMHLEYFGKNIWETTNMILLVTTGCGRRDSWVFHIYLTFNMLFEYITVKIYYLYK